MPHEYGSVKLRAPESSQLLVTTLANKLVSILSLFLYRLSEKKKFLSGAFSTRSTIGSEKRAWLRSMSTATSSPFVFCQLKRIQCSDFFLPAETEKMGLNTRSNGCPAGSRRRPSPFPITRCLRCPKTELRLSPHRYIGTRGGVYSTRFGIVVAIP